MRPRCAVCRAVERRADQDSWESEALRSCWQDLSNVVTYFKRDVTDCSFDVSFGRSSDRFHVRFVKALDPMKVHLVLTTVFCCSSLAARVQRSTAVCRSRGSIGLQRSTGDWLPVERRRFYPGTPVCVPTHFRRRRSGSTTSFAATELQIVNMRWN